jgi:hypothetical protein
MENFFYLKSELLSEYLKSEIFINIFDTCLT